MFVAGLATGILLTVLWYREPTLCERLHAERETLVMTMGREALQVARRSQALRPADMPALAARRADLELKQAETRALIAQHCSDGRT